ncbi:DUF134 domain-containing protein [Patescibacteria group bacterium]|nr:DUF134 domain-containing protein [Patescibacteria group bacterium]MBU2036327.1 DUF134 domain-containing protein [Patescibacteria group bacterium]
MGRPKLPRCNCFNPGVKYFKPQGIPLCSLEEEILFPDEVSALKFYDVDGLDQTQAAKEMGVSQPTFARILKSARKKVAQSIIDGKAIRIEEF